jgi:hypothetical protein
MSITEIEIAYSMLKPNALNPSALVFARSKAKLLSKKRALDVEARYKPLVAALTASGYPIELMGDGFEKIVRDRLWALIDRHYPHIPSADTGHVAARRHRQFAYHVASVLPPDFDVPAAGTQSFNSSWEACAVAGVIGVAERRRGRFVFEHFFTLEDVGEPMRLFNRRLLEFKQRTTQEVGDSHANIESIEFTGQLLAALDVWSARSGREVFVLLAEADRLAATEDELLVALSEAMPGKYSTTRVGDCGFQQHFDSARFLHHYLSRSGKALDADDAELLLRHPLACDLSYLRFAADHLIDGATHADLQPQLREVASVETFEQLAYVVRSRIDRLCAAGDNWRKVIAFGNTSRAALSPDRLRDAGLTPASYFRIQAALAPMMEHWGDWTRMHTGPAWTRLAKALL